MADPVWLDDTLSKRSGHLFIDDCDSVELLKRFGSPLFVLSENQIRRNVRRFQRSFQQGWPDGPVKVLPAAKANWIPAVQRILVQEGCGCDIYSAGELSVALSAGFDPSLISANGVPKDEAHIARCVEAGIRITIDSVEEIESIERATKKLDRVCRVRLRLRPVLSRFTSSSGFMAEGLAPTDLVALAYKGGLSFDEILSILPRLQKMEKVEVVGFHQHHGRHSRSTRYWKEQMRAYAREMGLICKAMGGFQPREIDIGGGFAIPRDPFNALTDYTEPLQLGVLYLLSKGLTLLGATWRYRILTKLVDKIIRRPNQISAPTIEDYAEVCTRTLREELPKHGIATQGLMLQLEPGRSLFGNSGIHLATVTNLKEVNRPVHWKIVVVDSTEFWLTGGRYEHHLHDYLFANKVDARPTTKADIIGRSCYGDRILPSVPIPEVERGDILALLDTGAYQEVSMSNFNAMPRPATVLVTGSEAEVVRRAETQEDLFRRDQIPIHLRSGPPSPVPAS